MTLREDMRVLKTRTLKSADVGHSGADWVGATPHSGLTTSNGQPADSVMEQLRALAGLFAAGGGAGAPIGSGQMWFGSTDPAGGKWMICDGRAISRTTYAELFNVMGTAYGAGDGTTTFNIPDLRARTPIGANGTALTGRSVRARGDAPGAETHTLSDTQIPAHSHTTYGAQATNTAATGTAPRITGLVGPGASGPNTGGTDSVGGGGAHNIMQPSLAVNFILRAAA